jgi:Carbohydrate binding domain
VATNPEERTVDQDSQRALPAPQPPDRPRGRHEAARRRSVAGPAGAAIAVVLASVVAAGVLATWLISSADEAPDRGASSAAATTAQGGPTSRPLGPGAFGNLVVNWSFEQDLNGWEVLGAADASREPQGRTSGSCASVRARGPEPGQVGLGLPDATPQTKRGQRYVASAWVRSSAPGQRVTVKVVGAGDGEVSQETSTTLPGLAWRRIIVDHTVTTAGPLRLEVVAEGVPAGDTLLVDEVVMRLG